MFGPNITAQRLPFREQNLRQRASGGYDVVSQPNPNRGMGPYAGAVGGNYSMRAVPGAEDRNANNLFAVGQNNALVARFEEGERQAEAAHQAEREADTLDSILQNRRFMGAVNEKPSGVFIDPRWKALRQALFEAGASQNANFGRMRTEATTLSPVDQRLVAELMR